MIGSVSAATYNLDDVVKSDATHKETIKHTHTTTTDTSSEKIVEKTNTNTINEKKSINNDKKEEKEEDEVEVNKLSTTPNNDLLKEGTDNGTFTTLNKNNDKDTLKETQPIDNWTDLQDAIIKGADDIKLTNNITTNGEYISIYGKVRINGDGHTIDAEKTGTQGIFYLGDGASLILENLKIINGQKNGSGGAISTGDNCNLTVTNCTFNQNTATTSGGAIYTEDNCNLTVTNCTFNQNTATNWGGAIRTQDNCNLTVTNCTFNQNTATYKGGAIRTGGFCDVNVDNALFCNNNAQSGDGIYCDSGSGTRIIKNSAFINDGYNGINAEGKIESINDDGTSFRVLNAWVNYGNPYVILTKDYTYNSTSDNEDYKNGIKITRDVTINGNGHTISGNQEARIFNITNQATVTLKNLKLINGTITGSSGGAIYVNNATVNINNTLFNQNTANNGGAIYATNSATVNINNTQFTNNTATNDGGAIFARSSATVNINNTQFNQNTATSGGAIRANGATVNINNTLINQNTATDTGGAIHAENDATVNINNTQFNQNTANNGYGGAIYASGVHVIVVQSSIVGSTADSGSAIRAFSNSYITINNTCISNNIANHDGTISVEDSYVNITRSNITNNTADYGGAIYTTRSEINIIYTSFIKNTAESPENGGGAIYIDENSKTNITNNLFTDNKANTTGAAIYARKFDNIKITNNIFLNNTNTENSIIYLDKKDTGFAFKYNLDYNWFANNATNYNIKPDITINNSGVLEELSNWLFLNATAKPNPVQVLNTTNITFKLSLYNSSSKNVTSYDNSQLKPVNLTITYTNGIIDKDIAKLNETIGYTPSIAGIGSVTARINGVEHTILVTVNLNPASVVVNNNTLDLTVDDTFELVATTTPGGLNVTYVPDDSGIVTVDENGKITALKEGTAQITVKINGKGIYFENSTTVTVTVSKIPGPTPSPSPEPTINPTKTVYKVKMYLTLKKVKKISKKTKKLYLKVIVKRNGKKLLTKKITIKVKRNKVKAKKTNKNKAKSKKLTKVQGFKFTVKINGKTYTKKTNKKGKITYTINNLYNKGTYKAKISYKSKYYKKNGKNIKFKIKA